VSLVIAVAVQQIGVDLNFETSSGCECKKEKSVSLVIVIFYFFFFFFFFLVQDYQMTGAVGLVAAAALLISAIVLSRRKPVPAEQDTEKLLQTIVDE
jgi:hypothetical protein